LRNLFIILQEGRESVGRTEPQIAVSHLLQPRPNGARIGALLDRRGGVLDRRVAI
jgi:hypothetical protein